MILQDHTIILGLGFRNRDDIYGSWHKSQIREKHATNRKRKSNDGVNKEEVLTSNQSSRGLNCEIPSSLIAGKFKWKFESALSERERGEAGRLKLFDFRKCLTAFSWIRLFTAQRSWRFWPYFLFLITLFYPLSYDWDENTCLHLLNRPLRYFSNGDVNSF